MSDAELLGNELREARQNRALTIEQAEKETRVRAKYLDALERADYASLPSEVQARGFLRIYARFLGLDADLAVSRFDSAIRGGRRRGRRVTAPLDPTIESSGRRTLPARPVIPTMAEEEGRRRRSSLFTTLTIGVVAIVLLIVLFVFGSQFLLGTLSRTPQGGVILSPLPRETSQSGQPGTTPTDNASPTPLRPTPLPIPNSPTPGPASGSVVVQLQITERTWLRVIVDGQTQYLGSAPPDTILQFAGNAIQIRAANGVAVHAVVNGNDLGLLGARGQIIDQTYTSAGTIQASPTPSKSALNFPGPELSPSAISPPSTIQVVTVESNPVTSPSATFSLTSSLTAPALSASLDALLSATPVSPTPRPRIIPTNTNLPTFIPPTATRTPMPTPTPTATRTFTNTPVPSDTPTPTMTLTPSLTWTVSPTYTPSLTLTPSLTPTSSNTPVPTDTPTPTLTPTASNTPFVLPYDTSTPAGGEIRPK